MTSFKVVAVIPALNEEETIGKVVAGACAETSRVIVVDDGSQDRTKDIAEKAGAYVISHDAPRGYGRSLEDGLAFAFSSGADAVVTLDADGQHDSRDIQRLIGKLMEGFDVVIAERPYRTHMAERIFALYTKLRFGIRDPLCGLKAYRRSVYEAIGRFDALDSIGTELVLLAKKMGFTSAVVPIELAKRIDTSRFYAKRFRANVKIFKAMCKVIVAIR
jgi:glycosyltransferase involved in cell wall biosynthesis